MKKSLLFLGLLFSLSLWADCTISTADELRDFATESQTTDFEGQTITLAADIDLASVEWTPIGNASHPFQGEFDGQNHVISNLYIFASKLTSAGLFAETGEKAEIHNVALAQGLVLTDETNNVGSLVVSAMGI